MMTATAAQSQKSSSRNVTFYTPLNLIKSKQENLDSQISTRMTLAFAFFLNYARSVTEAGVGAGAIALALAASTN